MTLLISPQISFFVLYYGEQKLNRVREVGAGKTWTMKISCYSKGRAKVRTRELLTCRRGVTTRKADRANMAISKGLSVVLAGQLKRKRDRKGKKKENTAQSKSTWKGECVEIARKLSDNW